MIFAHGYRIDRCPHSSGDCWWLQLMNANVVVHRRVFYAASSDRRGIKEAYVEALHCAQKWLDVHERDAEAD